MAKWIDIGKAQDFAPGAKTCLRADGEPVVVMNIEGHLLAFSNVCPHAGMPLGEGDLAGTVITCPFHGYAYDVNTGKNVDFPEDAPLRRYPVRIEDHSIQINVEPSEPPES